MKKIFLLTMALICSVVFTNCAAKRNVKNVESVPVAKHESDTQRKIRELKEQQELQRIMDEIKRDSIARAHQAELDELAHEHAVASLNAQAALESGAKKLLIPCMKEALELEANYQMAAQGMATGKNTQEDALLDANRVAGSELMTRFLGVIKNGIESYSKDSRTKNLSREQQSQLEGLCVAAGEKAINELMKPGCREFLHEKKGTYGCYVATYVPAKEVLNRVNDALAVAELDIDKAIMRNRLETELESQSQKAQKAAQIELERLQAMQEKVQ